MIYTRIKDAFAYPYLCTNMTHEVHLDINFIQEIIYVKERV